MFFIMFSVSADNKKSSPRITYIHMAELYQKQSKLNILQCPVCKQEGVVWNYNHFFCEHRIESCIQTIQVFENNFPKDMISN